MIKKILRIIISICVLLLFMVVSINMYIIIRYKNNIYKINEVNNNYDYALVLGCSVHKDGKPSLMLKDRLDASLELYNNGKVSKIIVSGDHSEGYSEVEVMEKYLINNNVLDSDIIRDNEGFNTRGSIKNYYDLYKDSKVIIVSQKYHLYRALLLANRYKLNSIGVSAREVNYHGQIFREIREVLARVKDFLVK